MVKKKHFPNLLEANIPHEQWLDDIYKLVITNKQGAFIDVGVHVGETLQKFLKVAPDRPYIGFEPQIAPCFMVEGFLIENNFKNCVILPIALSNKHGSERIKIRGEGYESLYSPVATFIDKFRPEEFYNYSKFIYTVPGDSILPEFKIDSISIIKIDVEGSELEVIEGLIQTIEKYKPYILFEVLSNYLVASGSHLDKETILFREERLVKLEKLIREKEYFIFQIFGYKELKKVNKIKPGNNNDFVTTNYLAVPKGEEANFVRFMRPHRNIVF